jgi:hypothetical protein
MKIKLFTIAVSAVLILAFAAQSAAARPFTITSATGYLRAADGTPLHAAGAHADFNTTFRFDQEVVDTETGRTKPTGDPKDIDVALPPGLVGNPLATPKCTQAAISELKWYANCEPEKQVGLARVDIYNGFGSEPYLVPVYNLEPPPGVAGQFAFNFLSVIVFVDATVTADGDYHLEAKVSNASQGLTVVGTSVTFWGVPASPVHDEERVRKGGFTPEGESIPSNAPPLPFMSNPTGCSGTPLRTEVTAASWQEPNTPSSASYDTEEDGTPITIGDCQNVPFEASLSAQPTDRQAAAPTGLDLTLKVAQNQLPEGLSAAHLNEAVIRFPVGMTINPAAAGGLGACTPDQIGLGTDSPPSCPDDSKIGTVTVATPLLEEPLNGSVYVAQQRQNKFGSLLAVYVVVQDPATGVLVKIPGKVEANPRDGSLVARFPEAPQLPFSELSVHLASGPRAVLVNPPTCGTYSTEGTFGPWSGTAAVTSSDSYKIGSGPDGGACPDGGFAPKVEGGTADSAAGRFSPFELMVTRDDGSEKLDSIGVKLPQGLLAKLAGHRYCPEDALRAIPTAEGTGQAQLTAPSCPADSRVGSVSVAAGAGSSPFWAKTGSAYLAGPYKGAPLSLAIVTPALAGPFDLGNVVVRTALRVDPITTQVTAESDPLPTILFGIPLDLRAVQVKLDDSFVLNPTSCRAQRIEGSVGSTGGKRVEASVPYAATGCAGLGFTPKLALALTGASGRTGNPALTATLTTRPGQADLAGTTVILPRSEFIDNSHIKNPCTRVQFAANDCPEASILGRATAWSPLLGEALTGFVYFRSNGGERKLPDLVADLHGQIDVTLVGFIDSVTAGKEGSRVRTRFLGIPDAPVSKFVLRLQGGKRGLIENAADLCRTKPEARVTMVAQNGKVRGLTQRIATSCGKKKGGGAGVSRR